MGYAHRGGSFLGELTRVQAPDPVRVAEGFGTQLPVLLAQPRLVPVAVAQEALQVAHPFRAGQLQGDRFDVLAFRVAQEALQIQFQQPNRFAPAKGRSE